MKIEIRKPRGRVRAFFVAVALALLAPLEAFWWRYGPKLGWVKFVNSIEAQGVTLGVSDGGSPTSYTTVANVISIKGPGGSANVIDVTNLSSSAKEKRMGLPDEGQLTFELNYDPDNATHTTLRNARRNRTRLEFKITLTDSTATLLTFQGYVLGFELSASVDNVVKAAVTVEIDGSVTEA